MRGNIVMNGYFQDPDATARAFDGGYFHSGDLAVWHPDGSVQIQDRMKDLIISGGEVCICIGSRALFSTSLSYFAAATAAR